jgi:hypothetical protein
MPKTIIIDDDIYEGLQKIATPFEDIPNTFIRKLLDFYQSNAKLIHYGKDEKVPGQSPSVGIAKPVEHDHETQHNTEKKTITVYQNKSSNKYFILLGIVPGWPLENPPPVAGSKSPTPGWAERSFI